MSELRISAALERTLSRFMRSDPVLAHRFESGEGTSPATLAHLQQSAARSAERIVSKARRQRPTPEERTKEIERRRKWAGGGNMPDDVRACYTEAERAALSVIADQCKSKGYCDLCLDEIARIAGVKRTSVQNAIRKARSREHAHISVRERRPQRGVLSLTNIIKIIGKTWLNWIERALSFRRQGGFKRLNTSESPVKKPLSESVESPKWAFERERADRPARQSHRLSSGAGSGLGFTAHWSGQR